MRSLSYLLLVVVGVLFGAPRYSLAAESATASVVVNVQFTTRTSLKVSGDVLRFDVTRADEPAIAVVDFSAAARTQPGGEVLLSVEPLQAVEGSLSVRGERDGIAAVTVLAHPVVAGRWSGSGTRAGRLVFALCAPAAGAYAVPLRFVLSAP